MDQKNDNKEIDNITRLLQNESCLRILADESWRQISRLLRLGYAFNWSSRDSFAYMIHIKERLKWIDSISFKYST